MTQEKSRRAVVAGLVFAVTVVGGLGGMSARAESNGPGVVTLTQTGCQFVEAENGLDRGYAPNSAADCRSINGTSASDRLAKSKPITLKAGKYVFRVSNKNVPYMLGFWLRSKDYDSQNPLHQLTRTSISGGGLSTGATRDFEVTLKPGEYLYSCPLNPTPDYPLVVTQ